MTRYRIVLAAILLTLLPSCALGINAGEEGGIAFIALTVTLLITLGIMWLALGRDR